MTSITLSPASKRQARACEVSCRSAQGQRDFAVLDLDGNLLWFGHDVTS